MLSYKQKSMQFSKSIFIFIFHIDTCTSVPMYGCVYTTTSPCLPVVLELCAHRKDLERENGKLSGAHQGLSHILLVASGYCCFFFLSNKRAKFSRLLLQVYLLLKICSHTHS